MNLKFNAHFRPLVQRQQVVILAKGHWCGAFLASKIHLSAVAVDQLWPVAVDQLWQLAYLGEGLSYYPRSFQ